ncbi:hypothetical protein [Telmatospirillum sp.]|uniref:hypothetical protein n=1 Tax=Telmatospirillum sp. TaxID=2079197 RepID=UPI0028445438|nr:hypothetical protein [Telmatospirillum sp.]MDR3439889.1 hypothetical protein [Telmatospirillum sp.]
MDTTIVELFLRLPPWVQAFILLVLTASFLVSHFLANTSTPAPNTRWGRVYTGLEIFGGLYGRAKDIGIPVPEKPTIEDLMKEIEEMKSTTTWPPFATVDTPASPRLPVPPAIPDVLTNQAAPVPSSPVIHEASNV